MTEANDPERQQVEDEQRKDEEYEARQERLASQEDPKEYWRRDHYQTEET